jgi:hypothetical protein
VSVPSAPRVLWRTCWTKAIVWENSEPGKFRQARGHGLQLVFPPVCGEPLSQKQCVCAALSGSHVDGMRSDVPRQPSRWRSLCGFVLRIILFCVIVSIIYNFPTGCMCVFFFFNFRRHLTVKNLGARIK